MKKWSRQVTPIKKEYHGLSSLPEYAVWAGIISRCYRKTNPQYNSYGGRGILMSKKWRNSFLSFIKDMGERPSKKHSVERKNNNKGYFKSNCCWALPKEQCRNTRRNVNYTAFGKTQCFKDWCIEYGQKQNSVKARLKRGMPFEQAITEKPQSINGRTFTYNGKTLNLSGWSKLYGNSVFTINYRLKNGWPIGRAITFKSNIGRPRTKNFSFGYYNYKKPICK